MVPRDHWGRPYIVGSQGEKPKAFARISKYADSLSDSYALGEWQQRMVAKGLEENRFLLAQVAQAVADDDAKALSAICHVAKEKAGAHDKASYGTKLHELTDAIDNNESIMWPVRDSPERRDLMAYLDRMDDAGFIIEASEQFVVNDRFKAAGTFDRNVRLGSRIYCADLKTGRIDIDPLKFAMQFALYANAEYYTCDHEPWLDDDGKPLKEGCEANLVLHTRTPNEADKRRAILIHLPAEQGKCDLYWVDIVAGYEACQLAEEVKAKRKQKGILTPFNPDDPPF